MTVLIKAAALGIGGAILSILLRRDAPELALALSIAISLLAASLAIELFGDIKEILTLAREQTGLSPAIVSPVFKCVGVGVITRLAADMCKDAGQGAIASAVELCGAACAMVTALPLVRALLQMIGEMV